MTERASALLDGELPLSQRVAVRMHLLLCVHCRRFARQLGWLVESLRRRAERQTLPGDFADRVLDRIDQVDRE